MGEPLFREHLKIPVRGTQDYYPNYAPRAEPTDEI